MTKLLFVALAILAFAAPANAYELDKADQRVPLPTRDWRFLQQQCDDYPLARFGTVGCAYFVEWQDGFDAEVQLPHGMGAAGYWHETGHIFDFTVLTPSQRAEFLRIMRIPAGTEWFAGTVDASHLERYHPPGELFADAYSLCALRATGRPLAGATEVEITRTGRRLVLAVQGDSYPYVASWRRHQRVCQLIGNAANRHFNWKTGAYR